MDNEEAKFILRAYRSNGADAGDAAFDEALAQAKRDPELARWFERERELDKIVAHKVRAITPPAGLRDAILAGGKLSVRPSPVWWRQPRWMALAASVALIVGLGLSWPRFTASTEARRFGEFAINDMELTQRHEAHGPGMGQLAALVSDASRKLGGALPIEFEALRANGCRTVRFAGHDVLEVCFERAGFEYHFYVMRRSREDRVGGGAGDVRFANTTGSAAAAVWSDDKHLYALVSDKGIEALKAIL
jgi:hypothetical protein